MQLIGLVVYSSSMTTGDFHRDMILRLEKKEVS